MLQHTKRQIEVFEIHSSTMFITALCVIPLKCSQHDKSCNKRDYQYINIMILRQQMQGDDI